MSRTDKKTGDKIYQTEDRQYIVKDQLLNVLFNSLGRFGEIIATSDLSNPYGDPRIDALTLFLTTFVLDEEETFDLIDEREQMINSMLVENKNATMLDRDYKRFLINVRVIAKCQSTFDNYYGIKKRQEIMRVSSKPLQDAKKKYGYELTDKMFACSGESNEEK